MLLRCEDSIPTQVKASYIQERVRGRTRTESGGHDVQFTLEGKALTTVCVCVSQASANAIGTFIHVGIASYCQRLQCAEVLCQSAASNNMVYH